MSEEEYLTDSEKLEKSFERAGMITKLYKECGWLEKRVKDAFKLVDPTDKETISELTAALTTVHIQKQRIKKMMPPSIPSGEELNSDPLNKRHPLHQTG